MPVRPTDQKNNLAPVPVAIGAASQPASSPGTGGSSQVERFEAERVRRQENLKYAGERGRCIECGERSGHWSRCDYHRMLTREDRERLGPPLGEHWPSPAPNRLPEVTISVDVPWE